MANGTIDSEELFLRPGRFGTANVGFGGLTDGLTGITHHNVRKSGFSIGQVVQVRCDGSVAMPGFSEFVYLQTMTEAQAKAVCLPDASREWYKFAVADASALPSPMAVVAISKMDADCHGWFWCGGVCPEKHVAALGGSYNHAASLRGISAF